MITNEMRPKVEMIKAARNQKRLAKLAQQSMKRPAKSSNQQQRSISKKKIRPIEQLQRKRKQATPAPVRAVPISTELIDQGRVRHDFDFFKLFAQNQ